MTKLTLTEPRRHARRHLPLVAVADLLLVAIAAGLLPLLPLLPMAWLRVPLGLGLALLAPGYALAAALLPTPGTLDGPTRAALSFGLSLALLPTLALLLDRLGLGLRPLPIAGALAFGILFCCAAALLRRWWASAGEEVRTRQTVAANWPVLTGLLALVLLAIGGAALGWQAREATAPNSEFSLLGSAGLATGYPRSLAAGAPLELRLGIHNAEGVSRRYHVELYVGAAPVRTIGPLTLADTASWEQQIEVRFNHPGPDQELRALLFVEGQPTPYRELRLVIDISS